MVCNGCSLQTPSIITGNADFYCMILMYIENNCRPMKATYCLLIYNHNQYSCKGLLNTLTRQTATALNRQAPEDPPGALVGETYLNIAHLSA